MTNQPTKELVGELRGIGFDQYADRLENQAKTIERYEEILCYFRKKFKLTYGVVLSEAGKNKGTGNQPSQEVEGDWV